ncbi:glycoside hydrolase family 3 C-terminal domain-containing protein [uncultured Draconibacterium sp.]|uniref:glycoside hydrolase family 3 C-terminal domain-containing protein n=1 Tax=uncultured Draconibacterium sp. TaxID=1573823 RepID=UPI0025E8D8D5|nr:glycoside hydrolase family 3 C-terminal domain-containing protein [uncultured Draconibacterium sp.]
MKRIILLSLLFACFQLAGNAQNTEFDWFDYNLPMEERIDALVNSMTIEEKCSQLLDEAIAIERLNVPRYGWWNECLHGVGRTGRATVFPQAIGLGATFDEELIFRVTSAIADEARAKYNVAIANNNRSKYSGLTFWSPNVNLFRDPRWGRGQETYGEDPYLTSRIGVAFVKGLQGDHPKYLKAAACAKHYVVHSGPEALRHEFDAVVSMKDLWETYMPAFKALVTEAKVEGVMGAYNRTNGEACCASPYLMTEVLRNDWGFDGYFTSDCGAVNDIWRFHGLAKDAAEASALAIKAGMNLNCGNAFKHLDKALERGLLSETDIDTVLKQLLKTRFRLGMFDPEEEVPFNKIGPEVVGCQKHVDLALEAAQKSVVLVKNENNVLPLKKDLRTLFVTGPQAANEEALLGNYFGVTGNSVNILDGIAAKVSVGTSINYKIGQMPWHVNANPIDWTTGEAAAADACIAVMGINGMWEGEEGEAIASNLKGDHIDARLPQNQVDFLKKIRAKSDKPLIVVITCGNPLIIPEVYEMADAVIYAWYPGEQGGNAVADIIFGDVSPSGRMPFTVPYSVEDLPPYDDYAMAGRTYRYMEKEPLFPFGFGLSYANFTYSNITSATEGDKVIVSALVENTGTISADEVAQLYISSPLAGKGYPLYALKSFKRLSLKSGEQAKVEFSVSKEAFYQVDEQGENFLPKGDYKITIGGSVPSKRSADLGAAKTITTSIQSKQLK